MISEMTLAEGSQTLQNVGRQGGGARGYCQRAQGREQASLNEMGDHMDIGPCSHHKHTEDKTGRDLLQVLLCRGGYVGKFKECIKVDLPIKYIHDASVCGTQPPLCGIKDIRKVIRKIQGHTK